MVTTSPTVMLPSIHMNMPEMMSFTSVCAPKLMAMPPTPATASIDVTLTPIMLSTMVTMMKYMI